jgi:hypothetical protein
MENNIEEKKGEEEQIDGGRRELLKAIGGGALAGIAGSLLFSFLMEKCGKEKSDSGKVKEKRGCRIGKKNRGNGN